MVGPTKVRHFLHSHKRKVRFIFEKVLVKIVKRAGGGDGEILNRYGIVGEWWG